MRRIIKLAAAIALVAQGSHTAAATTDVHCRNGQAEISCEASGCEVKTDGFTPMALSRDGNRLEVCAYSGCWKGTLDLIRTRGDLSILHAGVGGPIGPVAVVFNRTAKSAALTWGGMILPMSCGEAR